MGTCVSKDRQSSNGRPTDGGDALVDPRNGHRLAAQMNVYRGNSLHRHGSVGVGSPSMFHVNSSTGSDFYNGRHMQPVINPRTGHQKIQALFDYESRVEGDISFRKGDVMALIGNDTSHRVCCDKSPSCIRDNGDLSRMILWFIMHPQNGTGYIPKNFVGFLESLECESWYVGKIQRSLAEKLVSAHGYPRGTFLVRKRDSGNEYALTINDSDMNNGGNVVDVKHYKIRPLDGGGGYYITTKKVFNSIRDLIEYYSQESGGLCAKLTLPAPRMAPTRPDLSYDTQKNWEVPHYEIQKIKLLGDGYFGEVWYGKWRGLVEVAIKTMKINSMSVDAFLAEAQIMKQCNHPKLVKLYAVCTDREPYYIITEYMKNGSLLNYLRNENNILSLQSLVDVASQIANGMMYLEERRLVHRDLAARNVLVGEKISNVPEVKIADFGLARKLMDEENIYAAQEGAKFPIKWTAPEAATKGNFTTKSDVWSYGVLLFEIFSRGHVPYIGMHNREVIEQVQRGYRMSKPVNCPPPIYDEMLKCWNADAIQRPTFEHLYGFFDDYFISIQPNYVPPSIDDYSGR